MTQAGLRKFAALLLLGGVATLNACTYWHGDLERICDESERDFRRDPSAHHVDVTLSKLLSNPVSYKYLEVRFDAIYNRFAEKAYVPFWTVFDAEDHVAFSLWPAEAKLWSEERAHSHPLFYLRRSNPSMPELQAVPRFSLVRVEGRVMSDYDGKAWVMVTRFEVLEKGVYTDSGLADYALGNEALAAKKPAVAIRHFEAALKGLWTVSLRLDIHQKLARLYEARGDLEASLKHWNGVLTNDPDNVEATEAIERIQKAIDGKAAAVAEAPAPEPAPTPAPAPEAPKQ